jgi:glycosyltransferase involved in cell wall biosynthesis
MTIDVIIPAFNEENGISRVLADMPWQLLRDVIVIDNNSKDETQYAAKTGGATVLEENRQGYGYACLKGIDYIKNKDIPPDVVVFIDADYSDHPEEMEALIKPISEGRADLVIGSRALGQRAKGSMTPQQVIGNKLATTLIRWLYKIRYTDLGPFRAIRYPALLELDMKDKTYGWTVEMQLKAAKAKLRIAEIPVSYRVRIGQSKVSGTIKGTIGAGYKIITTIFKYL